MWFGTDNGLFRFDGTNIVYKRKYLDGRNSLPDNTVNTINEDKQGNIWVGTLAGIGKLNPYNLQCEILSHTNGALKGDWDCKTYVDHNGRIWAGNNRGLHVFDERLNRFVQAGNIEYATSITDYSNDTLAVGTFKGVHFVHKKNYGERVVLPAYKGELPPVTAMYMDSRNTFWIGTWGQGFQYYDAKQNKFIQLSDNSIVGGITESASNLWMSGSTGLAKVSVNKAITMYNAVATGYLYADESGTVWIAGESAVARFSPASPSFNMLDIRLNGVVYEMQALTLRGKQHYAISSWYHPPGLTIVNSNWQRVKQFGTRNVSGFAKDKLNRLWVPSLQGLTVMDTNFNVLKNWTSADDTITGLTRAKTNAVLACGDSVLVGCYKQGIDVFDMNYRKLHHFSAYDGSGLTENLFWKFFRDSKNNIWICGNTLLFKFTNGHFKSFNLMPDKKFECEPRDIAELPDGSLLIASVNGLIHFAVRTEAFYTIRSPLLPNEDNIVSVCTDERGNAWYLTTEHLVHYNVKQRSFTLFGAEDGLHIEGGLQMVRCFKPGELMIAQDSQVVRFNYGNLDKPAAPPAILITAVQVNDSSWQFNAPPKNLQLKHFQNRLYVEFSGIAYMRQDQQQYAVKLEGVDEDWVITNRTFASYANLGPGNYKLKIKAANYSGNWSNEYVMNVIISPPFWRTWWFISIAVLILGSIFYLVVRYISQRNLRERILILQKEQAVEKERSRIASDMHDDLGSGLTKIAILSEVAKKQLTEPDKAVRQLENISSSSRELVDNLQDIIWVLNPHNDSLESLAAYIREYALKFFEPMDVQLNFNYPANMPAIKLSEEVRRNIFLVMKETFNNIAKHANGKRIFVNLCVNNNNIGITVQDDGKGFETSHVPAFSNGLSNMRNRMAQIGGRYELSSLPDKGTTTKLEVTLFGD